MLYIQVKFVRISISGLTTKVYINDEHSRFQLTENHYVYGVFKWNQWKVPNLKSSEKYNMYITAYTFKYVDNNAKLFKFLNQRYEKEKAKLDKYDTSIDDETENGL